MILELLFGLIWLVVDIFSCRLDGILMASDLIDSRWFAGRSENYLDHGFFLDVLFENRLGPFLF